MSCRSPGAQGWVSLQGPALDMYALPVAGRRPPSRARAWAVVQHSEMNCVRDTRADTVRRFYWEGARGQRAAG